jgi:hypothetical protein
LSLLVGADAAPKGSSPNPPPPPPPPKAVDDVSVSKFQSPAGFAGCRVVLDCGCRCA